MEPTTLLLAATTYAAALVGRKAANEIMDGFWNRAKVALKSALGKDPAPSDVSTAAIAAIEPDRQLQDELAQLLGTSPVLRRARVVEKALAGSRILWIDDNPAGNAWEHVCLSALGCHIRTVESTRTALDYLGVEEFDLVLSDITRGSEAQEGLRALVLIQRLRPEISVIFYVTALARGVPAGAFGITNHPDELFHLCMDALERRRL
jgi:CheY-like chemotaxis protein